MVQATILQAKSPNKHKLCDQKESKGVLPTKVLRRILFSKWLVVRSGMGYVGAHNLEGASLEHVCRIGV